MANRSDAGAVVADADRIADARAFRRALARALLVVGYLGFSFWAAWMVLKVDVQGLQRLALVWGPVLLSTVVGGLVAREIARMDERERLVAYRSMTYAAFGLAGMMTGAAASGMMDPEPGDGVVAVAFIALPALLAIALLMPWFLRLFLRREGGGC